MLWEEILITRDISNDAIAAGLATVFGVEPERALVVADLAIHRAAMPASVAVICERRHVTGDFALRLTVFLRDDTLVAFATSEGVALIGRLCQIWRVAALVSDDSANPYAWLLVNGADDVRPVALDAARLDDDDAWVLAAVPEAAGHHPSAG